MELFGTPRLRSVICEDLYIYIGKATFFLNPEMSLKVAQIDFKRLQYHGFERFEPLRE